MFCTKCGAQIPDDAKFCTNCGSQVVAQDINGINQKKTVLPLDSNISLQFGRFIGNKTSVEIDKDNLIIQKSDEKINIAKKELSCATKTRVYSYRLLFFIAVGLLLLVFMPDWLVDFLMKICQFFLGWFGIEIGPNTYGTFKLLIRIAIVLDIISYILQFRSDKIEIKTNSNQSYDVVVNIFDRKSDAEKLLAICNQKEVV